MAINSKAGVSGNKCKSFIIVNAFLLSETFGDSQPSLGCTSLPNSGSWSRLGDLSRSQGNSSKGEMYPEDKIWLQRPGDEVLRTVKNKGKEVARCNSWMNLMKKVPTAWRVLCWSQCSNKSNGTKSHKKKRYFWLLAQNAIWKTKGRMRSSLKLALRRGRTLQRPF